MHNFKELQVWQLGVDLVIDIYKITKLFPKEEKFGLTSQINRAAVSIPSNIAEGAGRNSNPDFNKFLTISLGSTFELETQLIISEKLNYIKEEQMNMIVSKLTRIQKMIHSFKKTLN